MAKEGSRSVGSMEPPMFHEAAFPPTVVGRCKDLRCSIDPQSTKNLRRQTTYSMITHLARHVR